MEVISTEQVGQPLCTHCGAGRTLSFNTEYASQPKHQRDLSMFVEPMALRYGTLYRCKYCGQSWYLHGSPAFMSAVPANRLPLIKRWNENPILLSAHHRSQLEAIGATPPDLYGNGSEFHETPCSVTTLDGERIETAMVSEQLHAPFEEERSCRLATEIAELVPSPYALPLEVRVDCSKAEEVRMGFSPTLVLLPNGEVLELNGRNSFLVQGDCRAADVKLSPLWFKYRDRAIGYHGREKIVYFVADPATSRSL